MIASGVDGLQRGSNFQAKVVRERGAALLKDCPANAHTIVVCRLDAFGESKGSRRLMKLQFIIDLIHENPVEGAIAKRWIRSLTAAKQE